MTKGGRLCRTSLKGPVGWNRLIKELLHEKCAFIKLGVGALNFGGLQFEILVQEDGFSSFVKGDGFGPELIDLSLV